MSLLPHLIQFQRRHQRRIALRFACVCAVLFLMTGSAHLLLRRWGFPASFPWFVSTPLAALLGYWHLRQRLSLSQIARDLDRRYQLQERIATALERLDQEQPQPLDAWQLADAERTLQGIVPEQAYPIEWRHYAGPLLAALLIGVGVAAYSFTAAPSRQPMALPSVAEDVLRLGGEQLKTDEAHATLTRLRRAETATEMRQALANLRGETEDLADGYREQLAATLDALSLSEALKTELKQTLDKPGPLTLAQQNALLARLEQALSAEQIQSAREQIDALMTAQLDLQRLVTQIQMAQHQLASDQSIVWNQDGAASRETGDLSNEIQPSVAEQVPQDALVLTGDDSGNGEALLTQGTGETKSVELSSAPQHNASLAEQQGTGIAVSTERPPIRYQQPIREYLQQIAELQEAGL